MCTCILFCPCTHLFLLCVDKAYTYKAALLVAHLMRHKDVGEVALREYLH
jgi:hypothetical protein